MSLMSELIEEQQQQQQLEGSCEIQLDFSHKWCQPQHHLQCDDWPLDGTKLTHWALSSPPVTNNILKFWDTSAI